MNKLEQQKWQAQDDAMTMARYQEIMSDRARMQRAIKVAKKQAEDLSKKVATLNAVAKRTTRKK